MALITDTNGKPVAQSRNLRALLDGGRKYGGVCDITVTPRTLPTYRGNVRTGESTGADVVATYANGFKGQELFVCFSHACEWAKGKAARRGTWFTGCTVTIKEEE